MLHRLIALFLTLAAASMAQAQDSQRYAAVVLGSVHFGVDLNDFNPGLLVGNRWQADGSGFAYSIEGGVFYNSYEEVSPIVMGGVSHHIARLGRADLRGGVGLGIAYYGELAEIYRRDYDIPTLGGFIPLAVASLSLRDTRNDRVEYRLTALPGNQAIGALNFSIAFDF